MFLLPAMAVLAMAIGASAAVSGRWAARVGVTLSGLAIVAIVLSSPALPWTVVAVWGGLTLAWLIGRPFSRCRAVSFRSAARWAALACTITAGGMEAGRERMQRLPFEKFTTIYAVGDSVTTGLGRRGETKWPAILRTAHPVRIVDLSRAGSTVGQALQRVGRSPPGRGVVLLEIGGNDLIGRTPIAEFGRDLESLVRAVEGPDRDLVMFELPRFPFDDGYGIAQHRVAGRHGVRLIPRRYFARILATPGATVDGVHLSNAGQRALAALIWRVVGPAVGSR